MEGALVGLVGEGDGTGSEGIPVDGYGDGLSDG
jgi:hypothetical protein